jgi:hypothetical protein
VRTPAASVVGCAVKSVGPEALYLLEALAWGESPRSPWLYNGRHTVKVVNVELDVYPIGAILQDSDARQHRQLICDRPPAVGAGREVVAAVRIDVAVTARDCKQPRIMEPSAAAAFCFVARFSVDLVAVTVTLFRSMQFAIWASLPSSGSM